MKTEKLPRKLKKGLKLALINKIGDNIWSSKEVKIQKISNDYRYIKNSRNGLFRGFTITSFTLGL